MRCLEWVFHQPLADRTPTMEKPETELLKRIAAAAERTNELLFMLLTQEQREKDAEQRARKAAQAHTAQQSQLLRPRR